MDFECLAVIFERLETVSSGNTIRDLLAEFLKTVAQEDLVNVCYLLLGRISSDFDDTVLGIAEKSVLKSIALASGMEITKITAMVRETGDAGIAAQKVLQKKPRTLVPLKPLTVHDLVGKMHILAASTGSGSHDAKVTQLATLLQRASPMGARYVTRIALGTLRLGAGYKALLDALAIAFTGDKKNKVILEQAYNICPDVGIIAETLMTKGLKGIEAIDIQVGRPIQMMLCQRVEVLDEIPDKIPGEVTVEAKYDGERIQAHKNKKGKITLFSRCLDVITDQFPDVVKALAKQIDAEEFVVEGEVIAIDEKGNHLPFQLLMQRRRKYDVEEYVAKIPVQIKLFDVLYYNGKSFLHEAYVKRSALLEKIVHKNKAVTLTERIVTEDVMEMSDFFQKMLKEGYEGIIIKSRASDSVYQAGVRGWNWIKWKKDYETSLADTFDLVIIGAYSGRGKRQGVYGALLCAVYNNKSDTFESFCKLGTGLTDEVLEQLPVLLKKYQREKCPARVIVKKEMEPEVWFEPVIVVEVLGAEITQSPFHAVGLALRFPRFIRFRDDKKPEQATTRREVEQMLRK
ncbi:TPA: ATP-dependent DNA ligase [Candidatus Woesearchaeota archaeon]|nr:ATP-dependent DNA ligase [Candidatus Woesearchaeota archaeon]